MKLETKFFVLTFIMAINVITGCDDGRSNVATKVTFRDAKEKNLLLTRYGNDPNGSFFIATSEEFRIVNSSEKYQNDYSGVILFSQNGVPWISFNGISSIMEPGYVYYRQDNGIMSLGKVDGLSHLLEYTSFHEIDIVPVLVDTLEEKNLEHTNLYKDLKVRGVSKGGQ